MLTDGNIQFLADMLVNADKELRARFHQSPGDDSAQEEAVRRETYLATAKLWMKSLTALDRD